MMNLRLITSLALCSALGNLTAQVKPGKYIPVPPAIASPDGYTFESAPGDPLNARIYTLKNGLRVYLSVYRNSPRIQTYIAVRAGSKNDPADATGLAHYLEHMLFKGTDRFGTLDFERENTEISKIESLYEKYRQTSDKEERRKIYRSIDSISGVASKYAIANEYDKMLASIGAEGTNAFTSVDETVYVNDIPSNQVYNWLKIESERLRKPVLRLFHTELEAVYEEKNRGLDNDNEKVWESLFASLFKKHTYGTQTTIGTIEHLKNPSMLEIRKYYEKYYVPNNMAIIMSGDFDPDKVIAEIDRQFGKFEPKPVNGYTFTPEQPLKNKAVSNITGPKPANVVLAWRFAGDGTAESDMCELIAGMLYNRNAGLMDINLNQAQKVLNSSNFYFPMKDYSLMAFMGEPREGQSLEEVENLILGQIELLKKGEFPDWLIEAVITDIRLKKTRMLQDNATRADAMLSAFVHDLNWHHYTGTTDRLASITRKDLIAFANRNFTSGNYAVAYKKNGTDSAVVKVDKPPITPVDVNRDSTSGFVKDVSSSAVAAIEPVFIDYDKDIGRATVRAGVPLLHTLNKENNLFELYYRFDMGNNNDRKLPVAVKCIPYLGTSGMSAAGVREQMYRLGCSFDVFCDNEKTWISVKGLSDNFEAAIKLFEKLIVEPAVEESVLTNLVTDIRKERSDNKLQKRLILNKGMINYARYGATNPYTNVLSEKELGKLTVSEIRNLISSLPSYRHKALYYGPMGIEEVKGVLSSVHMQPGKLNPYPPAMNFEEKKLENTVYVVDYDMKQAEIFMLSNGDAYKPELVPLIALYNNYFGGGMNGVLFQDLRESKALAYSAYSRYVQPDRLYKKYYNLSYIGSQADKLPEALAGLSALLKELPPAEGAFTAAKEMIIQEMRTQRITRADIIFSYLENEELGNKSDIRKLIFEKVPGYTFKDVAAFHQANISKRPVTLLVLGKKEGLDIGALRKYGTVKYLTLEDIFGY